MEFHIEARYGTRGQKNLGMPDNATVSRSWPSTKLGDILLSEKPSPSYADFHHQITINADSCVPKFSGSQQSHGVEGKAKEDELVRYMSNLPSYLERGKNFQEKPLNVGVLDWRLLEKWKYNNNSAPLKNSGYSSSTSSTSYFSTDGSSSHSCSDQSSSSSRQRMHQTSLQSHLEASPMKTYAQDQCFSGRDHSCSSARQKTHHVVPHSHHQKVYPQEGHSQNDDLVSGNAGKFEEISASIPSNRIRQQKNCGKKQSGVRLGMSEKKESNTTSEIGKQQTWGNPDVVSSWKGKLKIRESELKEAMQTRPPNPGAYHPDCPKEHNTVVLLVPGDPPMNRRSAHLNNSAVSANRMPRECGGNSSSRKDNFKEVHGSDLSSNVPYSCSLPSEDDSKRKANVRESCSTSVPGVKVSSQQCPSRSRNAEEKSIVVLKSSSTTDLSGLLDKRTGSESITKVRHPSPIRRLGPAMGNIIRSAGSRNSSPLWRSSLKDPVAKPGVDRAAASTFSDTNKSQANYRARSSPLRRLLDPLIKPKAPNVRELAEPLMKDSSSTAGTWKLSNERLDLLKAESMKVKSTFTSAKTKGAKDSHQNVKKGSSLQALLQVAVKNGLPLLTFAVDNDSHILVATLRKSSAAEKDRSGWICTFFTIRDMKKKNALWPNQGRKANGHYVPNVVAQMVSGPEVPVDTRQKGTDIDKIREFTLFSVDVSQIDQHTIGFQPADELAAIVVKLLKANASSPNGIPIDPSQTSLQGSSAEKRDPDSSNTSQDRHSIRSQIPLSTTLILPGGVHTIPSKGSISTLTQRWRSGGSCDCGGWDLGCQLRFFMNHDESQKLSSSSKTTTNASDEFKLFSQVGQESQLVLRMNPFKDRIYSVEFDLSISLLQAFATCVAVLDCRSPSELFSNSNAVKQRSSIVLTSGDLGRMKASSQSHGEAPTSYITYPPHSPVGRV